ncbi:hypothetical protein CDL60_14065 [Roseateles noduli]|nr:hypothetical protein CDL60_14065 [Roseateles noduli]
MQVLDSILTTPTVALPPFPTLDVDPVETGLDAGRDALDAIAGLTAATELGDEGRAEAVYGAAIAGDPDSVLAYGGLIKLLCRQRREGAALDLINAALDRCDESAQLHYLRGYALESAGRWAAAMEAFGRALSLDRTFAEPHYRLGVLCERLGDPVTAARHLERYQRLLVARGTNPLLC